MLSELITLVQQFLLFLYLWPALFQLRLMNLAERRLGPWLALAAAVMQVGGGLALPWTP